MASGPGQDFRVGKLSTPLGKDELSLVGFEAVEELSHPFQFDIDAISQDLSPLDFNKAIGKNCAVTLEGKTAERVFCGILTGASARGRSDTYGLYSLTLRPWFWLLTHTTNCRIFANKTTPDIIKEIFQDRGFNDFELRLSESYSEREYTVQYRETDFDFISRMMEEEGIYYFFEHEKAKHIMVLGDAKSSHTPVSGLSDVLFVDRLVTQRTNTESFFDIAQHRSFQFGKVALNDYDYNKPSASMLSQSASPGGYSNDQLEIYDYPGRYTETSDGDRFAKVRLEAAQAEDFRRVASGDVPALVPGGLFTLRNHPDGAQNIEYLVVGCRHSFASQDYRSGGSDGDGYSGTYQLQPSDRPFRAPRSHRKPRVMGPQTAKVVGASGEEIDVDEMGRILVQFHWDRDKSQSRRVRVAQTWSGKQWGSIMIPRIGQEVVVEYLEGDPDQPLVIGTVYNGERGVPYALPANKTKGGVKSNSSKGGSGYNEFVFEDKKNSEQIGLHAQKDLDIVVLSKETREIGEKFAGSGASRDTKLKKGDDKLKLDLGSQEVDIAVDQKVKAGKSITLEAGQKITLKVGGSSIELTPAGVTITGSGKVDINGGAAIKAKAGIIKLN
ncbi:MAG: type VI secretion system tip protein TssI/VgrG [Pseudomonadota bacterium]